MKLFRALFLTLVLTATLFHSRPSQAAIGAIVSPALVIAGLYIAGTGGTVWVGSLAYNAACTVATGQDCYQGLAESIYAFGIALIGLVVLDSERTVEFSPLTETQAKKIGLSQAEWQSYNSEIDQVNTLSAHVEAEVSQIENATEQDAAAVWINVKDALAPNTFSALVKISGKIHQVR